MNELNQLRSLLLHEEQEKLHLLQKELDTISSEFRTPELITNRLAPLFSSILKRSHKDNEALILEVFSPIVNTLIDKSYETSQDKIAKQIAPLISVAIKEQIKSQKDDVVDALYPVIGSMISKYVSKSLEEMLNSINQQIQSGLSFETLKRKIKAKSKGVSEAQLLLDENSSAKIRAILLIHKESGVVLAEAQDLHSPINEPEMVASMMTAIRSFVNDWIDKNESQSEIGEIEYGGSKIVIESGGHSYLAAIVDGPAYNKTYEKIRNTFETIVRDHGDDIREFNGDMRGFPNKEIYQKISLLLDNSSKKVEVKKLHPIIFLIPILLFTLFMWNQYLSNLNTSLKNNINETIYKSSLLTIYRIESQVNNGLVTLSGEVPFQFHKELAQDIIKNIDGVKNIDNKLIVLPTLNNPMQISSNLHYLVNGLNLDDGINITYIYNYPSVKIVGETWDISRKNKVIEKIKKIDGIKNIIDKIKILPPNLKQYIYFDSGSTEISKIQDKSLIDLIALLKRLDSNITVNIEGYSDNFGTTEANKKVVLDRAKNVAAFIKQYGSIVQEINTVGKNTIVDGVDAVNEPNKARCAIITLIYRENNVRI